MFIIVFQLLILRTVFPFSENNINNNFSDQVAIYFNLPTREFTIAENAYETEDVVKLTPGSHQVNILLDNSVFHIPFLVTQDKEQHFTLFTPDELDLHVQMKTGEQEIRSIELSAIVFELYHAVPIGFQKKILISSKIYLDSCLFSIVNPIMNNSVNHYRITLHTDGNQYNKVMILKEGVAEFLKTFNPLIIDITDGKKISLFESEWVAELQTDSEILYRDQQQIKSVKIISQPDNAQVYIENELLGVTPLELFFTQNTHIELIIRKEGYYEKLLEIDMREVKNEMKIDLEERDKEEEFEL